MNIEEFALGDSLIHRLDPRVKIGVVVLYSVIVALNGSLQATAASICLPVLLVILARLSVKRILARMAVVNGFVLFLWLFLPFTAPGKIVYSFGPLYIYQEGLLHALLITLKSNAILLTVIALLGTSTVFSLVYALSHLGAPDKLVHLFFFCYRYVHVIHGEYHRLLNALKIRGFKPGTNMHTYRTYSYLVGMLLVRSFDRSARILSAMKCRGFTGRFHLMERREMHAHDYLVGASSILFSVILLVVR
jgi:cobalt/nickel transport system permease protein